MNPLPLVAVAGNPNAGKSALFNALTGARQKVGNYPGVTVERKSGRLTLADGRPVEMVDLPGSYSLDPASPDEAVTRDVLLGRQKGERHPDALVVVLDASNLDNHLRFALQLIELGLPTVVALNMVDLAQRDGLELDSKRLSAELGVPVIETVAVRRRGIQELQTALDDMLSAPFCGVHEHVKSDLIHLQRRAREIATAAVVRETPVRRWTHRLDSVASPSSRRPGHSRAHHVRHVSGGVRLEPDTRFVDRGCRRLALGPGNGGAARGPPTVDGRRRCNCRSRCSHYVPAADPDPVLLHPASGRHRLHGPRRLPDGPLDARRWPVRARLHSLAVELRLRRAGNHGDANDRRSEGPAHDDPRRAVDDLLGAPAGLHADHCGLHSQHAGSVGRRPAGLRHVRPLYLRNCRRSGRGPCPAPWRAQGHRRTAS